jgi:hypothetical protein
MQETNRWSLSGEYSKGRDESMESQDKVDYLIGVTIGTAHIKTVGYRHTIVCRRRRCVIKAVVAYRALISYANIGQEVPWMAVRRRETLHELACAAK